MIAGKNQTSYKAYTKDMKPILFGCHTEIHILDTIFRK